MMFSLVFGHYLVFCSISLHSCHRMLTCCITMQNGWQMYCNHRISLVTFLFIKINKKMNSGNAQAFEGKRLDVWTKTFRCFLKFASVYFNTGRILLKFQVFGPEVIKLVTSVLHSIIYIFRSPSSSGSKAQDS